MTRGYQSAIPALFTVTSVQLSLIEIIIEVSGSKRLQHSKLGVERWSGLRYAWFFAVLHPWRVRNAKLTFSDVAAGLSAVSANISDVFCPIIYSGGTSFTAKSILGNFGGHRWWNSWISLAETVSFVNLNHPLSGKLRDLCDAQFYCLILLLKYKIVLKIKNALQRVASLQ